MSLKQNKYTAIFVRPVKKYPKKKRKKTKTINELNFRMRHILNKTQVI